MKKEDMRVIVRTFYAKYQLYKHKETCPCLACGMRNIAVLALERS